MRGAGPRRGRSPPGARRCGPSVSTPVVADAGEPARFFASSHVFVAERDGAGVPGQPAIAFGDVGGVATDVRRMRLHGDRQARKEPQVIQRLLLAGRPGDNAGNAYARRKRQSQLRPDKHEPERHEAGEDGLRDDRKRQEPSAAGVTVQG